MKTLLLSLALLAAPVSASNTLEVVRHCLALKDLADATHRLREAGVPPTASESHTTEETDVIMQAMVSSLSRQDLRRVIFLNCLESYGVIKQ